MIVGNTCIKEEEVSSGAASDDHHDREEEIDVVSRSISPVPGINVSASCLAGWNFTIAILSLNVLY